MCLICCYKVLEVPFDLGEFMLITPLLRRGGGCILQEQPYQPSFSASSWAAPHPSWLSLIQWCLNQALETEKGCMKLVKTWGGVTRQRQQGHVQGEEVGEALGGFEGRGRGPRMTTIMNPRAHGISCDGEKQPASYWPKALCLGMWGAP